MQTSLCLSLSRLSLNLCVSRSRKPSLVCPGLCMSRSRKLSLVYPGLCVSKFRKPSLVCLGLKFVCVQVHETIASALCVFVLCVLPRKRHLPSSPMHYVHVLCVLLHENNINITITILCSLHLCYVRLSKKMTSMSPLPNVLSAYALCACPRRHYQHRHCHHCSSHESN